MIRLPSPETACLVESAGCRLDTSEAEPAPRLGTVVAAEPLLVTEAGEFPGELLLFTQDGYLSQLEECSWSDGIEVAPAAARHWIQRRSRVLKVQRPAVSAGRHSSGAGKSHPPVNLPVRKGN
ncbi:hypothetical protein [Streptomyces sp. NPDC088766]|uniref:hypothetical protein n=1 Tax=Streptomyces sp. NPDC088766 TaxID=3365893 RepID=UPI00381178F7